MTHSDKVKDVLSRREALKVLAAASGATALSTLPNGWETPLVHIGALPAFAQTSPGQYPFTHEIEGIEFSGAGYDQLSVAQYPGWIIVNENTKAPVAATGGGRPWLKVKRKWDVFTPPWEAKIEIKIKFKFRHRTRFKSTDVPVDGTDFWFFGMSGADDPGNTLVWDIFRYYVVKFKIHGNKVEIKLSLPAVGLGLYPFFLSAWLPFSIMLLSGGTLFPGYYVGPGAFGDQVKSSWLKK